MDWLDLLAVQETLKSFLQHHSSKASILQCSVFFIVQLSHPYMTTGKTITLTRRTFVGKDGDVTLRGTAGIVNCHNTGDFRDLCHLLGTAGLEQFFNSAFKASSSRSISQGWVECHTLPGLVTGTTHTSPPYPPPSLPLT